MNNTPANPAPDPAPTHAATAPGPQPPPSLWSPAFRAHTLAMLLAALLTRLSWALLVPVIPSSDSIVYDMYARTLARHGVYGITKETPGAFWPPGASALYAAVYRITDASIPDSPDYTPLAGYASITALHLILGPGVTLLTAMLGARLLGPRAGLLAGFLIAFWPLGISFTTVLQSEILFTFLLLAGVTAFVSLRERPITRVILCALAFAAAAYVRPTVLLVPPLLFGLEFLFSPRRARTFTLALATGVLMALAIAPWAARNTRLFGSFAAISTNSGTNLWMGNNPKSDGGYMPFTRDPALNELENDRTFQREAIAHIRAEPVAFARRFVRKLVLLHDRQTIGATWNADGLRRINAGFFIGPLKIASSAYWWALLACAALGIVALARRDGFLRALANPLVAVWVYFALVYAVYVAQDRYNFPLTPLVACLAALPILRAFDIAAKKLA